MSQATDDTMTRLALFGVPRRANNDYDSAIFRCPTHPNRRQYQSVRAPITCTELRAVSAFCYWCDAYGRLRGEPDFDRDRPQAHMYPLVEADDATP